MRALSLAFAILTLPAAAAAQGDGVYGRLDGDLVLEIAAGGGVAFEREEVLGAAALDLRARYLDVAGLWLGGELRVEGSTRVLLGVDVRPLWLARFLLGASFRDRYWDLLVDSVGVDLGVALTPLDESFGVALAVGFGLDVPLGFFDEGVSGVALRLFGRHVAALPDDRFGPEGGANDWVAGAMLVIRGQTRTGLPSWEPRRYELP